MGRKRIKQYLMLLLAIGVIAVVASGSGTFASFNAQVTNPTNTFAAGTLLLHDTAGTGPSTCTSESNSGNINPGTGVNGDTCATFFTNVPLAEADTTLATAAVTVASGTKTLNLASVDSTLPIQPGDTLTISDSSGSDLLTVVTASGTTVTATFNDTVTNSGHTYAIGSTVSRTTLTAYADLTLTNAGTLPASSLSFSAAASPACTATDTGSSTTIANTTITGTGPYTINVAALPTALRSGQTITVTHSGTATTYTLSAAAAANATQVTVSSPNPTGNISTSDVVTYGPEFGSTNYCNSLQFVVIETGAAFGHDSSTTAALGCAAGHASGGATGCDWTGTGSYTLSSIPTSLTSLNLAAGTGNTSALDGNNGTRHFVVGVKVPSVAGGNAPQGKQVAFGLTWRISQ